ncbi:hypothetical protein DFH09DRAFT_451281 [Mycena vulgaris]|nr:hypothetical protein DFH09DRAFT_451281 [Mycena vulgaris]
MSTTPDPAVPTSPFDDPDGDIILRSSDDIDFRLYRPILERASPVLEDMFDTPQAGQAPDPTLPVVKLEESAAVLDRMLRLWYPGAEPCIESLDDLCEVLETMVKYRMTFLAQTGQRYLAEYLVDNPVTVFAMGWYCGWEGLTRKAAKECLKLHLKDLIQNDASGYLGLISSEGYQGLLLYHQQCGAAASAAVDPESRSHKWVWMQCTQCPPRQGGAIRTTWMSNYVSWLTSALVYTPRAPLSTLAFMAPTVEEMFKCPGACRKYRISTVGPVP